MIQHIDQSGYVWKPFSVHFESPEGTFAFFIMAVSMEHACLQLDAIKETGAVVGEIVQAIQP